MKIILFLMFIILMEIASSESNDSTTDLPSQWKNLYDQTSTRFPNQFLKAYSSMLLEISSVKGLSGTVSQTIDAINQKIIIINDTLACSRSIRYITNHCEKHYINKLSPTIAGIELHYAGYHTQFRKNPAQTLYWIYKIHGFVFNINDYQVEYHTTTSEHKALSLPPSKKYTLSALKHIQRLYRWVWFINTISSCLILQDKFLKFWNKLVILFKKYDCNIMCLSNVIVSAMYESNKLHHYHKNSNFNDDLCTVKDFKEVSLKYAKCISTFHHRQSLVYLLSPTPIDDFLVKVKDKDEKYANDFQHENFARNSSAELKNVFSDL